MTQKFNISLPDWVVNEIIGNVKNRSGKIEELIIKGYMSEKSKNLAKSENITKENAAGGI